ncbi:MULTISPECIES: alpha/beta fold hydrolase [unclassified Bradyrhizobium]|uniref:alpha/beta fold hydrolase n=1 Tax=unclassified Bradyrhizobium TaxID=2631580 RepID=UPI000551CF16|nr:MULTISPECIES: alpha/beta hydrolase [unclassified Bradyrhizobium]MCP3459855.1 alpha/beta hydrolase [Bradyrhizobium sp. CCGUVB23]
MLAPKSRFYESHGLRLHCADWGNEGAPVVILVHGGRDHCRSWDVIARALQPHFHVLAPDLRGHGDSDWTKGGSYALTEYVYDLTHLVRAIAAPEVILVGHSMGGMVSLIYSASFPEQVSALVILDGVTVLPDAQKAPTHERITKWVGQLDKLHDRAPRSYRTIEDAAAQMRTYNKRLSRELALHLATHGVRQNEDGSYRWKFDPYQRVTAPQRLWPDDHVELWGRITCPTLLLNADESFLAASKAAGLERYFRQARIEMISGAGHWLHHDRPKEVLGAIRRFLGVADEGGGLAQPQ